MKQKFVTSWNASVQPRKQRKYRYNAPLHARNKFLSANLSKELRTKYGKRSLPLRKDDEVLVMRGSFAKKKGKILEVNNMKSKVTVSGISRKKVDGSPVSVWIDGSNVQIISLNLEDLRRLKRNRKEEKKTESKVDKKVIEKKVESKKEESKDKEKKNAPNKK